jgi:2-C-methyl-D-erythritol 4-phosphate cytidylyltransferase
MSPRIWAVLPAAGSGQRMRSAVPKQYLELAGCSVLEHSLRAVLQPAEVAGAVVALSADDAHWPGWSALAGKPILRVNGGAERADSVRAALIALAAREDADQLWALVHDAARPCLRAEDLQRLIQRCLDAGEGGLLAAPVRDTLKRVEAVDAAGPRASGTEPRAGLWRAFTPQLFPLLALREALDDALAAGVAITDEAMAMERRGVRPLLVEGAEDNLKITTPADLALAEYVLARRR